jgi:hypothetical protein
MRTLAGAWTKLTLTTPILLLLVSGCTNAVVSEQAICDGTAAATTSHALALAEDGGDLSVVTGKRLIQMLDAACRRNF